MLQILIDSLQIFMVFLDVVLLLFLLQSLIPYGKRFLNLLVTLVFPVLVPMQHLVRHSILHTVRIDISPYLVLIVLSYLEWLLSILQKVL